ncbi:hypothetical protein HPB48_010151 [Haemaphysalis longicornis]|uniref:CCHC-type domain-containing protein n=1 Tax=Haemaphysalis longicornis TaxID=44386 RepID=A0A9J6FZA5_HAELO|nr:hypothetical protein HPB48_010151 [Haemaphysalis longicornis]
MAGSEPGVSAAMSSRGARFAGAPSGYRFLLPSIPSEDSMRACLILHCDLGAWPYRIDDFRTPFLLLGVLKDIAGIGPFQMGHVWLIKLKTPEARQRLLDSGGLQVMGRYCAVIDPIQQEVTVKVHWVPFHVADAVLVRVFADFGDVKDVRQDTWGAAGFEATESTTRLVRMMLREDFTPDDLPHMLRFYGGSILVVMPGRAPQCLRCRRTGHILKDCRTPRCSKCKTFGHLAEECVRTYANVTGNPEEAEVLPEVMDDEEAELAASATTGMTKPPAKEGDEAVGGNAPFDAPPNTKDVAINEAAGATKTIHGKGNGAEEKEGNHSTRKLLESNDDETRLLHEPPPRRTRNRATVFQRWRLPLATTPPRHRLPLLPHLQSGRENHRGSTKNNA